MKRQVEFYISVELNLPWRTTAAELTLSSLYMFQDLVARTNFGKEAAFMTERLQTAGELFEHSAILWYTWVFSFLKLNSLRCPYLLRYTCVKQGQIARNCDVLNMNGVAKIMMLLDSEKCMI
jgi:hypothetical protein